MSRSEYHNLRKTAYRERWVRKICLKLGIEPDYNKAIDFALSATVSGLAVPNTASNGQRESSAKSDQSSPEASTASEGEQ